MEEDKLETELNKDAGDRLVAMHPDKPWFDKPSRLAGEQLEWLIPAVMGPARDGRGFYAGPAVMAKPGTVIVVCSSEKSLCTLQLPIEEGKAKLALDQIADMVQQCYPDESFTIPLVAAAMRQFIQKFGAAPGKAHPKYPKGCGQDVAFNIIGMLWTALGNSGRSDTGDMIEACIAAAICPAVVGLIGRAESGKKDGYSFALRMLPMAPYADSVLAPA